MGALANLTRSVFGRSARSNQETSGPSGADGTDWAPTGVPVWPVKSAVAASAVRLPVTVEPASVELPAATPQAARAGWVIDPAGRHEARYWNGVSWTEYVMNGGQVSVDWQRPRAS